MRKLILAAFAALLCVAPAGLGAQEIVNECEYPYVTTEIESVACYETAQWVEEVEEAIENTYDSSGFLVETTFTERTLRIILTALCYDGPYVECEWYIWLGFFLRERCSKVLYRNNNC